MRLRTQKTFASLLRSKCFKGFQPSCIFLQANYLKRLDSAFAVSVLCSLGRVILMSFCILPSDKQPRVLVLPIARLDRKTYLPNIYFSYVSVNTIMGWPVWRRMSSDNYHFKGMKLSLFKKDVESFKTRAPVNSFWCCRRTTLVVLRIEE